MTPLTDREREILMQALGLNRCQVAYRNQYVAAYGTADRRTCLLMVGKGWMVECSSRGGLTLFQVTEAGRAMVGGEHG